MNVLDTSSYGVTLLGVTSERVTVSLPEEVRRTSQRIADELGLSFSAVVTEVLTGWLRARLVDAWLAEHQAEHGVFDEDELRALPAQAGVPYLARLLPMIDVRGVGLREARAAGELLATSGTTDAVDALIAMVAVPGDQLLTSDPADLGTLITYRAIPVTVVSL